MLATQDDQALFSALYRTERGLVRRYLQRVVGPDDADDMTAEVFATVWRRWPDVPAEPARQRAWVFQVAHYKAQEMTRARYYGRGLLQRLTARRVEVAASAPEDDLAAMDHVRELMAQLPSAERRALELVVFGELSSAEAADVLGCKVSAVTSRVSRARRRLRSVIRDEEEARGEAG